MWTHKSSHCWKPTWLIQSFWQNTSSWCTDTRQLHIPHYLYIKMWFSHIPTESQVITNVNSYCQGPHNPLYYISWNLVIVNYCINNANSLPVEHFLQLVFFWLSVVLFYIYSKKMLNYGTKSMKCSISRVECRGCAILCRGSRRRDNAGTPGQ